MTDENDKRAELASAVDRLTAENAELSAKAEKANCDKDIWIRLYNEKEAEANHLRNIVKALNVFAGLV